MNSANFLDHTFWISVGGEGGQGRGTVRRNKVTVSKLHDMLAVPSIDASVSIEEYLKRSKTDQDYRKAQPGFLIAGRFRDGKRRITHQLGRSCIQIDIDAATPEQFARVANGNAQICSFGFIVHTTRSLAPEKPRFRMLVFLDREVNAEEANALTRLLSVRLDDDE